MAACLVLLALCAGAAGAWETSTNSQLGLERQRRLVKELLGRERWRQLEAARFQIHLHDLGFTPELSDNPARHDEVGRVLLRSLLKASQESVERRLRLEERRDALRGRYRRRKTDAESWTTSRPSLDVSPRVHLDSRLWLGAKLRLPGIGSRFWSHTDLRLGSELDGQNPSLKLAFMDHARHGFLVYHANHRQRGEAIELRIGFSY